MRAVCLSQSADVGIRPCVYCFSGGTDPGSECWPGLSQVRFALARVTLGLFVHPLT